MTTPHTAPVTAPSPLRAFLVYGGVLVFGLWCIHSFRRDLGQISLRDLHGGWGMVLLAAGLSLVNYACRAIRWHFYLRTMGHRMPWRHVVLSYLAGFAFTLSPGKVGEMVRARYYTAHNVPLQDVTAAFFAERMLDLLVILLLALVLLVDQPAYRVAMWLGLGLLLGVSVALVAMPWARLQAWAQGHTRSGHWALRAVSSVAQMLLRARRLLSPINLLWAAMLGVLAWGAEAVGFKLVGDVIHPEAPLSWSSGIGIYATATLVGGLSFLPGGLGSTEAAMSGLLVAHGYALPQAMLLTMVCRVVTLWLAIAIGWLCVWRLKHDDKQSNPQHADRGRS